VLSPSWTPDLIAALKADPEHWRLVSGDHVAVIFVRPKPPTKARADAKAAIEPRDPDHTAQAE